MGYNVGLSHLRRPKMKALGFFFFLTVGALGFLFIMKLDDSYQGSLGLLCLGPLWAGIFLSAAIASIWPKKKPYQMAKKPKK
ncbi:MAG: hypothetical protein KatS3mg101_0762 [Patescibacteria group bacterium]|nr:MAG: hypothetical protein KatS3mg101_0762 [Patescibacteria group bacterium]